MEEAITTVISTALRKPTVDCGRSVSRRPTAVAAVPVCGLVFVPRAGAWCALRRARLFGMLCSRSRLVCSAACSSLRHAAVGSRLRSPLLAPSSPLGPRRLGWVGVDPFNNLGTFAAASRKKTHTHTHTHKTTAILPCHRHLYIKQRFQHIPQLISSDVMCHFK